MWVIRIGTSTDSITPLLRRGLFPTWESCKAACDRENRQRFPSEDEVTPYPAPITWRGDCKAP